MRAFIAVDLPEELKKKVQNVQDRIDMTDADIKFVEPENLHYTLKFLGEITEEDANKVKAVLDEIGRQFEAFHVNAADIGAFPSSQYAKVVWVGAREGGQVLKAMAEQIEIRLGELGFEKDDRFEAHLTIGRVRSAKNKPDLILALKELATAEIGRFLVSEIRLYRSVLTPQGPEYTVLYSAKLKGSG